MKQRYLVGKMNNHDEREGGPDEVTMETLGERFFLFNATSFSSRLNSFFLFSS